MSDVYSFGVVIMLELLSGKKPFDRSRPRSDQSLVRWATPQLHDIDASDKMVDKNPKGFLSCKITVAVCWCCCSLSPAAAGVQTTNVRSRSTTDSPRATLQTNEARAYAAVILVFPGISSWSSQIWYFLGH